jgi:hypothetical protein
MYTTSALAAKIERLQPELGPHEVALGCLVLPKFVENIEAFDDEQQLGEALQRATMQFRSVADQHQGINEDLEALANREAGEFRAEDVLKLLRAVHVQTQMLQFFARIFGT